jgi:hypothetical protein
MRAINQEIQTPEEKPVVGALVGSGPAMVRAYAPYSLSKVLFSTLRARKNFIMRPEGVRCTNICGAEFVRAGCAQVQGRGTVAKSQAVDSWGGRRQRIRSRGVPFFFLCQHV